MSHVSNSLEREKEYRISEFDTTFITSFDNIKHLMLFEGAKGPTI